MRVDEMTPGFHRGYPAGALHQDAGDDLQAVGDAVLKLLEQDRLLSQQVVLQPLRQAGVCDVSDRQQQAFAGGVAADELMGGDHQASQTGRALEVHLIGVHLRRARERGPEQRAQLRDVPLARPESEQRAPGDVLGFDLERPGKRSARCDHLQIAIEQHDGRIGGCDQRERQAVGYDRRDRDVVRHRAPQAPAAGSRSESHARR